MSILTEPFVTVYPSFSLSGTGAYTRQSAPLDGPLVRTIRAGYVLSSKLLLL